MNTVDGIARRNSERAVMEGLAEVSVQFTCKPEWLGVVTRHFMGKLVGRREAPTYTADQIKTAFNRAMEDCSFTPRPVDLGKFALALLPPPPMQKMHNDPLPGRKWTDAERAANLARMDEIMAYIEKQNGHPDYGQALSRFGKGSAELGAVVDRQTAEMQAWMRT